MSEATEATTVQAIERSQQDKQPSKENIRHLRHQIKERMPEARRVFNKSGTTPTQRELINAAGEKLRQEAESDYDILTGLLNKNGYEKQAKKAIENAYTNNIPLAVGVVDLDDLKVVNDSQGHDAGDRLLQNTAGALRAASRDTDLISRIGGDEFRILLVNTTTEHASAWKERFNQELLSRRMRASTGISEVDLTNVEGSIKAADEQMYVEKREKKQKPGRFSQIAKRFKNVVRKAA